MVTRKRKAGFVKKVAPHPKTQEEMRRRIRSLSSSDARLAVEWLNATQGAAAHRRVTELRGELEELGGMLDSLRQQKLNWKKQAAESDAEFLENRKTSEAKATFPKTSNAMATLIAMAPSAEKFRERHNALNKLLARYTYVPAMAYDLDSGIWRFATVPKPPRGPEVKVSDEAFDVRVNESTVIAALARLASNRELHKVRLCETCGKNWRVSERKIDRFCSQQCREAFYAKSPDFLERKAANQRKYRDRLKPIQAIGLA